MSTDNKDNKKFDRGWRFLTSQHVLARLEHIDELLARANGARIKYLKEQRSWWEKNLELCRKRENRVLREWARSESANLQK
jgi:hypothetical protein